MKPTPHNSKRVSGPHIGRVPRPLRGGALALLGASLACGCGSTKSKIQSPQSFAAVRVPSEYSAPPVDPALPMAQMMELQPPPASPNLLASPSPNSTMSPPTPALPEPSGPDLSAELATTQEDLKQLQHALLLLEQREGERAARLDAIEKSRVQDRTQFASFQSCIAVQTDAINQLRQTVADQQAEQWRSLDAVSGAIDKLLRVESPGAPAAPGDVGTASYSARAGVLR